MVQYTIISEQNIEIFITPQKKQVQQVITYQAPGMAPRTVWISVDQLPDVAWQIKNPGKPVSAELQAQGDKVRRAAFDSDIAKISRTPAGRQI